MADPVLEYIIAQEHAGYTEQQIRQALANQGYPKEQIDAAFRQLGPAKLDPDVHEYVQQYARQGYAPVQIFSQLTQQGYPAKDVRKAINEVFGPLVMPQNNHATVFIVLALIIAVGGFFLILRDPGAPADQPPIGQVPRELSLSEQIARVITIAEERGKDDAIRECTTRLFDEERAKCLAAIATFAGDDALCDEITNVNAHDACLMSFLNEKFDSVCVRVKLRENIETCESIRAFKTA